MLPISANIPTRETLTPKNPLEKYWTEAFPNNTLTLIVVDASTSLDGTVWALLMEVVKSTPLVGCLNFPADLNFWQVSSIC